MPIKAGQILHAMNQFVVDRIQTAGAQLNIPEEKIAELGNYQTVGIVRDTPDLTFSLDALDVDTEIEALLTGSTNPTADTFGASGTPGHLYSLSANTPVDIVSPFKSGQDLYDIVQGIAIPYLGLESASYKYGLQQNAGESFSLRGDSIYYTPGVPYVQTIVADGTIGPFLFNSDDATPTAMTALKLVEGGANKYALCVTVNGHRKVRGVDFTDSSTGITFVTAKQPANLDVIRISYASRTVDPRTYDQTFNTAGGLTVKPAAIRGKDIEVRLGSLGYGATPAVLTTTDAASIFSGVQSVNVDWRITLESDFEFGNPNAVSRDYSDIPQVSGTIDFLPIDVTALFNMLRQITGVTDVDQIVGANSSVTLPLEIRLKNPDTGGSSLHAAGTVLKTLYMPSVRFQVPGYSGNVGQKMIQSLAFGSDTGVFEVYKGLRTGS